MTHSIIQTEDGSHTLYVESIDEHYHSTNGAIEEAQHVYIYKALQECKLNYITVFEVGFGTGLNAFLTAIEASISKKHITLYTIEKFPIEQSYIKRLNYVNFYDPIYQSLFFDIHNAAWNTEVIISEYFTIVKMNSDIQSEPPLPPIDVVYFDAFAPNKQPELWTIDILSYIFGAMNPNGILTTYCAKGEVRRNLQQIGFTVERTDGPPGKREMLRATKRERV